MKSYRRFLAELKRRKVFKVAAVYGAVGYGVLQLSDILVPALDLPDSPQVCDRFIQADLLRELGRPEEARRWYETIDQLSVFDLPYRSVAARRLAEMGPT
jgi:hypothetical protein